MENTTDVNKNGKVLFLQKKGNLFPCFYIFATERTKLTNLRYA